MSLKRSVFLSLAILMTLAFVIPHASAAVINNRDALVNHLKIAGYEVEIKDEQVVKVQSRTEADFIIRGTDEGLLFRCFFGGTDKAKSSVPEFLRIVNALNEKAMLVRYYIDSDNDLAIEALFPGDYDQRVFTIFLNSWRKDMTRLVATTDISVWVK
jgi:hypothetical protein